MKRVLCAACVVLCLIVSGAQAAPTQSFSGDVAIGDSLNTAGVLIGMNFDVDGNGTDDVNLAWCGIVVCTIFGWSGDVRAALGSSTQVQVDQTFETNRFAAGELIGPTNGFGGSAFSTAGAEDFVNATSSGEFFDGNLGAGLQGYLGFSFDIGGATHWGWMEIVLNPYSGSVPPCTGSPQDGCLRVLAYGYETSPDTGILAGAVPLPAPVALLAGALPLLIGAGSSRLTPPA